MHQLLQVVRFCPGILNLWPFNICQCWHGRFNAEVSAVSFSCISYQLFLQAMLLEAMVLHLLSQQMVAHPFPQQMLVILLPQ